MKDGYTIVLALLALGAGALLLGVLIYALGRHFGLIKPDAKLPWWWPHGGTSA